MAGSPGPRKASILALSGGASVAQARSSRERRAVWRLRAYPRLVAVAGVLLVLPYALLLLAD